MLTQNGCVLDSKVSARFEGYRTMKTGNRAPDIDFKQALAKQREKNDDSSGKYLKGYKSLSSIDSKYKLIVFGFNECPECMSQLPQLKQMYPVLQQHNMEVIYVSLDTEKSKFEAVAADKPWVSYFDYAGWEGRPVADYYVFASPTMYLLGEKEQILYKVVSPQHLEAILKMLK
jgi:thioredoxin-related protein